MEILFIILMDENSFLVTDKLLLAFSGKYGFKLNRQFYHYRFIVLKPFKNHRGKGEAEIMSDAKFNVQHNFFILRKITSS